MSVKHLWTCSEESGVKIKVFAHSLIKDNNIKKPKKANNKGPYRQMNNTKIYLEISAVIEGAQIIQVLTS